MQVDNILFIIYNKWVLHIKFLLVEFMDDINKIKEILGFQTLNNEITNIMAMIYSNSKLAEEVDDGYFIAR